MRRVLLFSLTYTPFIGGAEVAIREITDRLRYQDISFDMITLRFDSSLPEREKVGNITVYRVGFARRHATTADTYRFPLSINKYLFPFLAYRKARELHATHFYDVLWSMQANYAGFAALFTKNALPHVPFVLTLQEGGTPEHYLRRVGPLRPLYKKIFRRADVVQVISEFLAGFARDMGYTNEIVVVPNGVSVERFMEKPPDEKVVLLQKKLAKKKDERYLITVSRLVPKNGVDTLVASLTHLPKTFKLIVVGEGPLGKKLWKLARRLGVADRVWFAGHISQKELPLYLHTSDIFVRPSRSEGQGISFIEAMAAGLPVVATPVGGITDFLFDPVRPALAGANGTSPNRHLGKVTPTGLFCDVDDPKSIADAVQRIMKDDELRDRLIENARQMVKEKYDWDTIAKTMYNDVFSVAAVRPVTKY